MPLPLRRSNIVNVCNLIMAFYDFDKKKPLMTV